MNVLLVDDQELIVNSLKGGLDWERLGVEQVYTATNSYEAKFLMMNYPVDLLITDIEMPEEDGIALAEWVSERFQETVIVFLTSHPNFQYAREGVRLHVFDYLLQPVRFSELERVVERTGKQVRKLQASREEQRSSRFTRRHRNAVFDSLVLRSLNNREEDVLETWQSLEKLYEEKHGGVAVYLVLLQVHQWESVQKKWADELLRTALSNILAEVFEKEQGEVGIANIEAGNYWGFLFVEEPVAPEVFRKRLALFLEQVNGLGDFRVSGVANDSFLKRLGSTLRELKKRMLAALRPGEILWENVLGREDGDPVEQAMSFIQEHLQSKLSRQEVAEQVHLNPEYLSKLFRKEMGLSLKDYILTEKMKQAASLLTDSNLPIGLIASKVGFDNFSHFSRTFQNYYKMPPKDYRQQNK